MTESYVVAFICVKNVQIRSYLWSEYKKIRTRLGALGDRIGTLCTQCLSGSKIMSKLCLSLLITMLVVLFEEFIVLSFAELQK